MDLLAGCTWPVTAKTQAMAWQLTLVNVVANAHGCAAPVALCDITQLHGLFHRTFVHIGKSRMYVM